MTELNDLELDVATSISQRSNRTPRTLTSFGRTLADLRARYGLRNEELLGDSFQKSDVEQLSRMSTSLETINRMSLGRQQEFIKRAAARIVKVVEEKGGWSLRPPNIEQRIERGLMIAVQNDLGTVKEHRQAIDLAQLLKELTSLPVERLVYDAMEALEADKPQRVLQRWFKAKEESRDVKNNKHLKQHDDTQAQR